LQPRTNGTSGKKIGFFAPVIFFWMDERKGWKKQVFQELPNRSNYYTEHSNFWRYTP
jgi:hypothetical protein